jgi:uncharacterized protein
MLEPALTDVEVRILGSLIEKEVTTPDNFPLSLSALAAACNQTSNREPVMQLDEGTISEAIVALRRRSLLRAIQPSGSRVTKYSHLLGEALNLDARELAVLDVLMLRGPQTPGELNARTGRLAEFADLAQIETTLEGLATRQPEPLVVRLPRRAGQKEVRYAHLMSGEPAQSEGTTSIESPSAPPQRVSAHVMADAEQLASLRRTVDELKAEMAALRAQFEEFRAQFQ